MTGLATLLPVLLTLYLIYVAVVAVHDHVGRQFTRAFCSVLQVHETVWVVIVGDIVCFAAFLVAVWLVGFLLATYLGRVLFRQLDRLSRRIPLVRLIYPAFKQLTDFFLSKQDARFRRVVAVEYPRRGVYVIGFMTGEGVQDIKAPDGEQLVTVFVPSSPTPFTGSTTFMRRSEIIPLNIPVDQAIKLIISGGVVVPESDVQGLGGESGGLRDAADGTDRGGKEPAAPAED